MVVAHYPRHRISTRAQYARTNGNFLINDPLTNPADSEPMWWLGIDSGGGASPIGPNGPWSNGGWGNGGGTGMFAGNGNTGSRGPAVITRATALITGPLTAAPFQLADPSQPGRDLPQPRWLVDPMQLRPDLRIGDGPAAKVNRLARSIFWAEWIRSAIWYGEGPFIYTEDQSGQPVAGSLMRLNPLLLGTDFDEQGALVWTIDAGDNGDGQVAFDRDGYLQLGPVRYRICVLRNPHSPIDNNGRSTGVFGINPGTFRLGSQIETYASGTFRSGVPAGYLKVNIPDAAQEKIDRLKANWLAAHGGDRRSIAVLNANTEFVPLNLSPVDAALVDMSRLSIAQIAYAFGLDPGTLGVSLAGSMTYNNVRDVWINHRDFGLAPWIAAVQDTLSALTPAGQTVLVDLDGFANPTRAERYNALKVGIESGIITIDEARQMEGLPPIEEPDQPPAQLQIVGPVTGPATQPAIEGGSA